MPVTVLVCFCTCPDTATAQAIADALVGERLAACVNVLPGLRSVYRWQGAIERADEALLLIKTVRGQLPAMQARVVALHPYELPELVAVEVAGGLAAYLDWIAECSADGRADTGD
jgi:periplasmic divalent cation tolerance protein